MQMTPAQIVEAIADGSMSVEAAADDFAARDWPREAKAPATSGAELLARSIEDVDPPADGGFFDVTAAFHAGKIDRAAYDQLADAYSTATA